MSASKPRQLLGLFIFILFILPATGSTRPYAIDQELHNWHDTTRDRLVPVKLFAPERASISGPLATIIFSHGFGESRESFNYLGRYWAEQGYIAVFLTHAGSDTATQKRQGLPKANTQQTFDPRPADIRFVLAELASDTPKSRLVSERVDFDRLAIAGQCLGSTTALYMVGLTIKRPDGSLQAEPDPRFKAAIALSPQIPHQRMLAGTRWLQRSLAAGGRSELHDQSWAAIQTPTLVVTGTRDFLYFPAVRANPRLRRMAYDGLPGGDKYLVDIVDAEHHAFTDSEPWYPGGPRDPRHHRWIGQATTAFLDAYLQNDRSARQWLQNQSLSKSSGGLVLQEDKTEQPTADAVAAPARSEPPAVQFHRPARSNADRWLQRLDKNGDGMLSRQEIPQRMQRLRQHFEHIDRDGDGRLSQREIEILLKRRSDRANRSSQAAAAPSQAPRSTPVPVVEVKQGSLTVSTPASVQLHDPKRHQTVGLEVVYPTQGGPFPLLIFSHHQGGAAREYRPLAAFWASHGYVCVLPEHADSPATRTVADTSTGPSARQRPLDISFIIDALPELTTKQPALRNKIDRTRIGVGGHYLGAHTAYLLAGARWHPVSGPSFKDERISAVLLLSPQGIGQGMTQQSWAEITIPMLTVTGSRDYSRRTGNAPEWRTHPYRYSAAGDKYLVYIDDYHASKRTARHPAATYSGVIGPAHASYVYHATLDFWNAYLKNDKTALTRLKSGALETLSQGAASVTYR